METVAGVDEAGQTPQATEPAPEQTPPKDTEQTPEKPGFGERGRMRRRARFLRKARELAYRDLGGLVFDLHRFGQRNDPLVLAKLAMLRQLDTELRELEARAARAPPGDGAARSGNRGVPAVRGDPRQRRPLLPGLRAGVRRKRRPPDLDCADGPTNPGSRGKRAIRGHHARSIADDRDGNAIWAGNRIHLGYPATGRHTARLNADGANLPGQAVCRAPTR